MRNKLLFIALLFSLPLWAQSEKPQDTLRTARIGGAYFRSYWYDTRDVVLSPFHPTKRRLIGYGVAAAGLGIAFTQDANIQRFSQENRNSQTDWAATHVFEPLGSGDYSLPMLGVFYLTGLAFHQEHPKKVALLGLKAYLVSGLIARIPKYGFSRMRPNAGEGPDQWFSGWGNNSFVSGHTTSAFSVATIIALEYRSTVWVPILAYTAAVACAYSRINDNKHWASDVVGGAFLGYGVSSLIYHQNNWGVYLVPTIRPEGNGMSAVIPF